VFNIPLIDAPERIEYAKRGLSSLFLYFISWVCQKYDGLQNMTGDAQGMGVVTPMRTAHIFAKKTSARKAVFNSSYDGSPEEQNT